MNFNIFSRHANRKPARTLLPTGTWLLIDAANLLGYIGPQHAARTLETVFPELVSQGYRPAFFFEYRSYAWVRSHQGSDREELLFDAFVGRDEVAVVDEEGSSEKSEADAAILAVAEVLTGSVCVSKDHFDDYIGIHPGIVHTDRVRGFTVLRLEARTIVAFSGVRCAVSIDATGLAPIPKQMHATEIKAPARGLESAVDNGCDESASVGVACERTIVAQHVVRTGARHSKRWHESVREDAFSYEGGDWDCRESLDFKQEKRRVQSERRYNRLRVQAIREGHWHFPHFSPKRRVAAEIAALGAKLSYGRVG